MPDEVEGTGIDFGGGDPGANQDQDPGLSTQGRQFLDSIPEDHREVVGQYLPKWDSGFTKFANGVNQQLAQYKEFGEPEDIRGAVDLHRQFLNDPTSLVDFLFENRDKIDAFKEWRWNAEQKAAGEQQEVPPWMEHLNPIQEKMSQFEKVISVIAENLTNDQQAKQQAEADAALDRDIDAVKQKYGDAVDIAAVMDIALARKTDLMQAAVIYNQMADNIMSQRAAKQAPITLGASSQPQLAKPATEMSADERKKMLTTFLGQ